ncbi:hypothetical protein ACTZWW_09365 [Salinarimonas sp. NSM]|uniref:hypothetical protein n=1 Tax=Salinarimonas sp. NSM TaxID=3458003 RepID=UPI0040372AB4
MRTLGSAAPGGESEILDGRGGTAERLLPHLNARLDGTHEEGREPLLLKAFLLLADAHGDLGTALRCLEEAAVGGHGARDDSL